MKKISDAICCRCGAECDGSLMRMDSRYDRVRYLITSSEVPRFTGGGVALCHMCQRSAYFCDGFLDMLITDLRKLASGYSSPKRSLGLSDRQRFHQSVIGLVGDGKSIKQVAELVEREQTAIYDVIKAADCPSPKKIKNERRRFVVLSKHGIKMAASVARDRGHGVSWNKIAARMGKTKERVMAAHIALTGGLDAVPDAAIQSFTKSAREVLGSADPATSSTVERQERNTPIQSYQLGSVKN
jgi:hypothetical protein